MDDVQSLPSRERGLKYQVLTDTIYHQNVAPFTGAWIEMIASASPKKPKASLPSRERGLK